jgi:glucokinase
MTRVLAIDLGGTKMRAALFTGDVSDMQSLTQEATPTDLASFTTCVMSLLRETGDVGAIGLAVPGLVSGSTCRWIPNLPYLDSVDVEAIFPGLRIGLGNDAQLALLAEARAGAAKGMSDAVLLSIGTGIGSAVLAGGAIVAGAHGGACSFGWACADVDDAGEDRSGWLERVASGRAFDRLARQLGMASGSELVAAARSGDQAATAALEKPANQLGMAAAAAAALLDPQAIVITGGLADALDVLGAPITASLRCRLPPHLRAIEVRPGMFGARAAIVGAALAGAAGSTDWRQVR